MKKIQILLMFCFVALSISVFAQIKVTSSGYVGINQSNPSYNLDWGGNGRYQSGYGALLFDNSGWGGVPTIHPEDDWNGCLGTSSTQFNVLYVDHVIARAVTETSDEKVKTNIKTLNDALRKITKLRGVSYDLKPDYFKVSDATLKAHLEKEGKNEIGFLAQELKEVFPEVVFLDTTNNLFSVNYTQLIPVLVEAIKEQQVQIDGLNAQIEDCCKNNSLKSTSIATGTTDITTSHKAQLDQNIPNPFSQETKIGCFIPEDATTSVLYIYNMNGTQLQQYSISGKGKQSVMIDGNSFQPGMYLYALVIDGQEVDTKRMILTK